MKNLVLIILSIITVTQGFSQGNGKFNRHSANINVNRLDKIPKSELFCIPKSSLNFSTGVNGLGGIIPLGAIDPYWKSNSTNQAFSTNIPTSPTWNKVNGAATLSPTSANNVAGTQTFKRTFFICKETQVNFSGNFRNDNMLVSFKLMRVATPDVMVWNHSSILTVDPQCWANIAYSASGLNLTAGQYYFEFIYNNQGSSFGGFAINGNITASNASLANSKDCCCNCPDLTKPPVIQGPTCICKSRACEESFTYSVPPPTNATCVTYEWSATPNIKITNSETNTISIPCKLFNHGKYTIKVKITCDGKSVIASLPITVCGKLPANFSMASNGSNATFQSNATSATNYWVLVKDDDNNCVYSNGETIEPLISTPSASYSNLANNQQYTMYHFVYNDCSEGCGCLSIQIMCFKWLPPNLMKTTGEIPSFNEISNKTIQSMEELPVALRQKLPKEIMDSRERSFKSNE